MTLFSWQISLLLRFHLVLMEMIPSTLRKKDAFFITFFRFMWTGHGSLQILLDIMSVIWGKFIG